MTIVTEGDAGAKAVAACAFKLPFVLDVAHIAFNTSPALKLKIASWQRNAVSPLG